MLGNSFGPKLAAFIVVFGVGCAKRSFGTESRSESGVHSGNSVRSGSGVNNGPGPVGDILKCKGKAEGGEVYDFVIRHTAAVTFIQGLLQIADGADNAVSMNCKESVESGTPAPDDSARDMPVPLWTCQEQREGEGRWSVDVSRQGLSAVTLADVFLEQMFPLPRKKMGSMACEKLEE